MAPRADDLHSTGGAFPTTHRSVVARLSDGDAAVRRIAFESVVECYWKALYKYLRIRWRCSESDAQDLTQTFFTSAFEKEFLATYDPAKARFRTFLRACADRMAANAVEYKNRMKRGGGAAELTLNYNSAESEMVASQGGDPSESFDREWTRQLLENALAELHARCAEDGRERRFLLFEEYYILGGARRTYAGLAEKYQMKTTDVTNELSAARRDFRDIILKTLRTITSTDEEFKEEARFVLGAFDR